MGNAQAGCKSKGLGFRQRPGRVSIDRAARPRGSRHSPRALREAAGLEYQAHSACRSQIFDSRHAELAYYDERQPKMQLERTS